jgi:hypothetical protein
MKIITIKNLLKSSDTTGMGGCVPSGQEFRHCTCNCVTHDRDTVEYTCTCATPYKWEIKPLIKYLT